MPRPLSTDLRESIVNAAKSLTQKAVATLFGVSRISVGKFVRLERAGNSLTPKSGYQKGHSQKLDLELLKDYVEKNPVTTLKQAGLALGISIKTVHKGLKKIGITKKKERLNI